MLLVVSWLLCGPLLVLRFNAVSAPTITRAVSPDVNACATSSMTDELACGLAKQSNS